MIVEEIKAKTKVFIARSIKNAKIQDDDDIFELGFVNSLFAIQLVMFIEKEFQMTVEDEDLNIDNFRTINAMANMVSRNAL